MLAAFAWCDIGRGERVIGRSDRHELDRTDGLAFKFRMIAHDRPANRQHRFPVQQACSNRAHRLHMQAQRNRGEHGAEFAQHMSGCLAREHYIDHKRDIAFQPCVQTARLGE